MTPQTLWASRQANQPLMTCVRAAAIVAGICMMPIRTMTQRTFYTAQRDTARLLTAAALVGAFMIQSPAMADAIVGRNCATGPWGIYDENLYGHFNGPNLKKYERVDVISVSERLVQTEFYVQGRSAPEPLPSHQMMAEIQWGGKKAYVPSSSLVPVGTNDDCSASYINSLGRSELNAKEAAVPSGTAANLFAPSKNMINIWIGVTYFAVLFGYYFYLSWRYGVAVGKPLRELTPEELGEQRFKSPSLSIASDDFRFDRDGKLVRLNSDGEPIRLRWWKLNVDNGQFQHILRMRGGESLTNSTDTYKQRRDVWIIHSRIKEVSRAALSLIIGAVATYGFLYLLLYVSDNLGIARYCAAIGLPLVAILVTNGLFEGKLWLSPAATKARIIGPEPLQFAATEDYGPAVGKGDDLNPETDQWKPFF